ncbi:MAG: hypothetical protein IKH45_02350, partial [Neisseriaceae bacterium]|nr:hypothetical protein [Neisseriaceae bacterium]
MGSLVVGTIYFGLMFILAGFFLLLALIFPKQAKGFFITAACIVVLFIVVIPLWARLSLKIMEIKERPVKEAAEKRYNEARAVFDEQCKKVGEKIYRTVDNVDGIMLLKVRYSEYKHANDPMWENAAMYKESTNGFYIHSFFEDKLIDNNGNIYISDNQKTYVGGKLRKNEKYTYFNGYQFVDVQKKDGRIIRYSGKLTSDEIYDKTEPTLSPK